MSIEEVKRSEPGSEAPKLGAEPGAQVARSKPGDKAKAPQKPREGWVETAQTIAIALMIALVVRSILFQPFNIPSESMKPTLLVGDFLFVSKFAYGYSRHSLPLSVPLIPGRILFSEPKRGDVIVFKTPHDNRTDYIKRLIGLPGDDIQMIGGVLHINGQPVQRRRLGEYVSTDPRNNQQTTGVLFEETLPNGVTYTTLDIGHRPADDTGVYHVPAGHYFMMGDNRDNSTDSRVPTSMGGVGYVPAENLVGRAELLFFSIQLPHPAWQLWRWFGAVRYGRLFHMVN